MLGDTVFIDPHLFGTGRVTLSVENTTDSNLAGGLSFMNFSNVSFSAKAPIVIDEWDWIFPGSNNPNNWFTQGTLEPQAASFGPALLLPPGESVPLAEIQLSTLDPTILGFDINFGEPSGIFADGALDFLTIDEGTHSIHAVWHIPEPGSLSVLVVGTAWLLRRRGYANRLKRS